MTKTIAVSLPPKLAEELQDYVSKTAQTRSLIVEIAIRRFLATVKKPEKEKTNV